jgi:transposase
MGGPNRDRPLPPRGRTCVSDEEWALLEPLMPSRRKGARNDDRKVMNAIFYVFRTGIPWRDLPERYGPYTTAYNLFNRWSRRGVWKADV